MKALTLLAIALIAAIPTHAQDDLDGNNAPQGPRVILRHVADSIYMFEGKGGNVGIFVGGEGGLMIDSQFPDATSKLMKGYEGMSSSSLKYLINTHHHGDHTGGNANFKAMGITIISHNNVRTRLIEEALSAANAERDKEFESRINTLRESGNENSAADLTAKDELRDRPEIELKDVFPSLTIRDKTTIHLNGEEIELIPLNPGHTNGDILVWFKNSNVIHTGDAYVKGRYPYIDTKSGGAVDGYFAGLKRIMNLINDDTKIIPGHGAIANMNDLKESHRMFESILEDVTFFAFSGKTLEEILAMKEITKAYDDKGYGEGFITTAAFVEALYAEPAAKYKKAKK